MPKTPITYYGGKITLLNKILPLIPEHRIYTEAFFGGGAVYFAKEPVESEVINDRLNLVVNFYEVARKDFNDLRQKIEASLFARKTYMKAKFICETPNMYNKLEMAWAFYVATNMGFTCQIGSWGYDKYGKRVKSFLNKKLQFNETIPNRLAHTQIENNDACKVIKSRDTSESFHYVDPPYINSNQGHYGGYSEQDYKNLLDTLSNIEGKFLLSSYPSEILEAYIQKNNWYSIHIEKPLSASKAKLGKKRPRKIEVLTANYPIEIK